MKTFLPLVLGALSFFSTTPAVVGAVVCFPDRDTLDTAISGFSFFNDGVGFTYVDAGGNNYGLIQDWCFASTLTDFSFLFSFKRYFNAPIGGWDVSQVTDMGRMFSSASAFNQDIGGWDVSQVTDMGRMFSSASAFNQDIGGWNVSQVTDMGRMFSSASAFNQEISGWDVSQVTDMGRMFSSASAFNQEISGWDVSHVTDMEYMFSGASALNGFRCTFCPVNAVCTVNIGATFCDCNAGFSGKFSASFDAFICTENGTENSQGSGALHLPARLAPDLVGILVYGLLRSLF